MPWAMALIPGMFYAYVVAAYILNARIGAGLSWSLSYVGAGILTALYAVALAVFGKKKQPEALKK